jgi:hypothetical protein
LSATREKSVFVCIAWLRSLFGFAASWQQVRTAPEKDRTAPHRTRSKSGEMGCIMMFYDLLTLSEQPLCRNY